MTPVAHLCTACADTIALVSERVPLLVCDGCGAEYVWRLPPQSPRRASPSRVRVWVAPEGDAAPLAPLACQGREALRALPEDPELVRVRALLFELRPDAPDPRFPPAVPAASSSPFVVVRDPSAAWGGIPRGVSFGSSLGAAAADPGAEVLARIAAFPPNDAVVLRWLREHASLEQGLRGLYVDVGVRFASPEQHALWSQDLQARRDGAAPYGRRLVLGAAAQWEAS